MIKSKKQMFIVIGAFALIMMLGTVSYAFFNYSRTGNANNIRTGNIYFNTTEGTALNITNLFPMTSTEAESANLDSLTIGIVGNTTYVDGEEFEITLTGVNNTINNKEIPINYIATYTPTQNGNIGSSSDTYFDARLSKNANIYKLSTTGEIIEGQQILVGYIDNEGSGINGTLSIKAYIDADRIAISDTYNGPTGTPNDNMGTTSTWVDGRVVLTTSEWNSLASTPIGFQVKAVSQEGIWVDEPASALGTIDSCPGCMFVWVDDNGSAKEFEYGTNGDTLADVLDGVDSSDYILSTNYNDVITPDRNYFMGMILDGGTSGKITRVFACGVKSQNPNMGAAFCIEGTHDGSKHNSNISLITGQGLWNDSQFTGQCRDDELDFGIPRCSEPYDYTNPSTGSAIRAGSGSDGSVYLMRPSTYAGIYINMWGGQTAVIDPTGN